MASFRAGCSLEFSFNAWGANISIFPREVLLSWPIPQNGFVTIVYSVYCQDTIGPRVAYKSSSNFSRARSASGRLVNYRNRKWKAEDFEEVYFVEWVGNETRVAPFIQAYKVRRILAMRSFFVPLIRELAVLIFFELMALRLPVPWRTYRWLINSVVAIRSGSGYQNWNQALLPSC